MYCIQLEENNDEYDKCKYQDKTLRKYKRIKLLATKAQFLGNVKTRQMMRE